MTAAALPSVIGAVRIRGRGALDGFGDRIGIPRLFKMSTLVMAISYAVAELPRGTAGRWYSPPSAASVTARALR